MTVATHLYQPGLCRVCSAISDAEKSARKITAGEMPPVRVSPIRGKDDVRRMERRRRMANETLRTMTVAIAPTHRRPVGAFSVCGPPCRRSAGSTIYPALSGSGRLAAFAVSLIGISLRAAAGATTRIACLPNTGVASCRISGWIWWGSVARLSRSRRARREAPPAAIWAGGQNPCRRRGRGADVRCPPRRS